MFREILKEVLQLSLSYFNKGVVYCGWILLGAFIIALWVGVPVFTMLKITHGLSPSIGWSSQVVGVAVALIVFCVTTAICNRIVERVI